MEPLTFETFHFYPSIMAGVRAAGYTAPTSIQAQAIPLIMQGKDVIGIAETGTGKTAAYALPVLHNLWKGERGTARALVISPTTELAKGTCAVIETLEKNTGLSHMALHDEENAAAQKKELRSGRDIIVGCPGRLLDFLWKNTLNLSDIQILVVDEADLFFRLGLLPDLFNILSCIPMKRQTLLFSATLPDNIRRLSRQFMKDPVTVQNDGKPPATAPKNTPPPVPQPVKTAILKELLKKNKNDSVLVYTRTNESAGRVVNQVMQAGYQVTVLQGKLARTQKAVPGGLPAGPINILVVTGTTSIGTGVADIFRIINDTARKNTVNDTNHAGRSGRVDKHGDSLTLVTSADTANILALEKFLEGPLERLAL